ncbi:hypothetical protein EV122DRAFT_200865 [Schizophyllum commune]
MTPRARSIFVVAALASVAQAYFLMGSDFLLESERIDPIVNQDEVSPHAHRVLGGSNFGMNTNTSYLRESECTSVPIDEDKSAYWTANLWFHWANGSMSSVSGGNVMCVRPSMRSQRNAADYLFSDESGKTTAFPDGFQMISGNPSLRTFDENSVAQKAITYLCLDFDTGETTKTYDFPTTKCKSGFRSQINFPMCWNGVDTDSEDHQSHVAFAPDGPDGGSCTLSEYPVTLPRIFMEVYWDTTPFDDYWDQAANTSQPFVLSNGDSTGYSYHADYIYGWDSGVLQNVVDSCHCDPSGGADCCANQGLFTLTKEKTCKLTKQVDEDALGTLAALPGNNAIVGFAGKVDMSSASATPAILAASVVTSGAATATGEVIVPAATGAAASATDAATSTGNVDLAASTSSAASSTKTCSSMRKRQRSHKRHALRRELSQGSYGL